MVIWLTKILHSDSGFKTENVGKMQNRQNVKRDINKNLIKRFLTYMTSTCDVVVTVVVLLRRPTLIILSVNYTKSCIISYYCSCRCRCCYIYDIDLLHRRNIYTTSTSATASTERHLSAGSPPGRRTKFN